MNTLSWLALFLSECLVIYFASMIFAIEFPYIVSKESFALILLAPWIIYGFYLDLFDHIMKKYKFSCMDIVSMRLIPLLSIAGIYIGYMTTNYFIIRILN